MGTRSIRNTLTGAFGLLIVLFAAGMTLALFELQRAAQERAWTTNRYEQLLAVQRCIEAAASAPGSAQAAYVETPNGAALVSVSPSQQLLGERLVQLGALVGDDAAQQERVSRVASLLLQWRAATRLDHGSFEARNAILGQLGDIERAARAQLTARKDELASRNRRTVLNAVALLGASLLLALFVAWLISRRVAAPLTHLAGLMERLARHDHAIEVPQQVRSDEVGAISRALQVFKDMSIRTSEDASMKAAVAAFSARLLRASQPHEFADLVLDVLLPQLGCTEGAVYVAGARRDGLERMGWRGLPRPEHVRYGLNDVRVRCAAERTPQLHAPLPPDYAQIYAAAGVAAPAMLALVPLVSHGELLAIVELAGPGLRTSQRALLDELAPILGLAFDNLMRGVALQAKEADARHRATHDALTGLPNRTLFADRLEHAVQGARRAGHAVALLYLDLDGFKSVNDGVGHAAGDRLLVAVARRLHGALREFDTVARLGGDEFAIILEGGSGVTAAALAQGLCNSLQQPFDLEMPGIWPVKIGSSIGVAMYPGAARDPDALIRAADAAMYEAKRGGRNRWVFAPESGAA